MTSIRRYIPQIILVATLAGCSAQDPARFDRPPVVQSFAPPERRLSAFVGDTLQFSLVAMDPDRDALSTSFTVDGGAAGQGTPWYFPVADTGCVTVRGSVSDGAFVSFIEWTVEGFLPVNHPPQITAFQPLEPNPVLVIGNRMAFGVVADDPDEDDVLAYQFTLNDSLVASTRQFEYLAGSTGRKHVVARVTDGEHFVFHEWNLRVTTEPDTIAPARVAITGYGTGAQPGEVYLEWIAVGRDGMTGIPSEYRVRTAPERILTEGDWNRASQRPGVPAPVSPGEPMSMVVGGLLPAQTTYLAVRAVDDFGNISPLGESPLAVTRGMKISGTVINTATGQPVAGATIWLGLFSTPSGPDGSWVLAELPPIDDVIRAGDVSASGVGSYFDVAMPYAVNHLDVKPIYLIPNRTMGSMQYSDFLEFFRSMTDIFGNPFGTQQRRWQLPVDLYVRAFDRDGLDYKATIERVAGEFDAILGTKVFNVTSIRTGVGVETICIEGLAQDNYGVTEWTNDWYPHLGLVKFRTAYTPATAYVLERTVRHELGHALGLNHSSDIGHLMVGGVAVQVDQFSDDEVAVLRSLYAIPRGFDNRRYLWR